MAAIAIPNLMTALQKGKQKSTMGDMKTLGNAIDTYIADWSWAPRGVGATVTGMNQPWFRPFYVKSFPTVDAWGTVFQWANVDGTDTYSIITWGKNLMTGGPAGAPTAGVFYDVTHLIDFNNDIVFSDGAFTFDQSKEIISTHFEGGRGESSWKARSRRISGSACKKKPVRLIFFSDGSQERSPKHEQKEFSDHGPVVRFCSRGWGQ